MADDSPMTESQGDEIISLLRQIADALESLARDVDGANGNLIQISGTLDSLDGALGNIQRDVDSIERKSD